MSTYESMMTRESSENNGSRTAAIAAHQMGLYVSLHGIEFSREKGEYWEVARGVFFSEFLYLLFIRRVSAGPDFEKAREKTRNVLTSELAKKKYLLLRQMPFSDDDTVNVDLTRRRLSLLETAISILETSSDRSKVVNYKFV